MSKTVRKSKKTHNQTATPADETSPAETKSSHPGKKILSIAIEPGLHSKLALLARAEGRSVTDLCVEALSKNLAARISKALDALRAEIGEG